MNVNIQVSIQQYKYILGTLLKEKLFLYITLH